MNKSFSLKQVSSILLATLLTFGAVVLVANVLNYSKIGTISRQWTEFDSGPSRKSALLNDLRGAIGLGGVIHQFQSFTLRRERTLLVEIQRALRDATVALTAYDVIETNATEKQALKDIRATLLLYREGVAQIEVMAARNESPTAIDKAVHIDEKPALNGLRVLDNAVKQTGGEISIAITAAVKSVLKTVLASSISTLLFVVLLAVSVLITMRYIHQLLGGEPGRILSIVERIASGDLSEEIKTADNRGILKAMQQMQHNLRAKFEADKVKADENERLRQALDTASANVTVVDVANNIIYANDAAMRLFTQSQSDIAQELGQFSIDAIKGFNIDRFSTIEGRSLGSTESSLAQELRFGTRTLSVVLNPVKNHQNERLGMVLEWVDRTTELNIQNEIQSVVNAASIGDLSQRIDISGKSGFFKLFSEGMNQLVSVNEAVVDDVQQLLESLAHGDLDVRMSSEYQGAFALLTNHANTTVSQLSAVIRELKQSVDDLGLSSRQVVSIGLELGTSVTSSSRRTSEASQVANSVSGNLGIVASATVKMSSSIEGVAKHVFDASEVAREATQIAHGANENVLQLADSSNAIGGVTKVITSIAEQTNLLALNATIEAARAGEAGKGFAVVANEVKELAKETSKATEEIESRISSIQRSTEGAVDAISKIVAIVSSISSYQNLVAIAVDEQISATNEITRSVQNAASDSEKFALSISQVSKDSENVQESADNASSAANKLAQLSESLNSLTERFNLPPVQT